MKQLANVSKIKPALVGAILSGIAVTIYCIAAVMLGIEDSLQFPIILALQAGFHFLIGYSCWQFGLSYGFSSPLTLFWFVYSYNHLFYCGVSNIYPVCAPSQVLYGDRMYVMAADKLVEANTFVFLSYLGSIFLFNFLMSYTARSIKATSIRSWVASRSGNILSFLSLVILGFASLRIGVLYGGGLVDELSENSSIFDFVSPQEKFFYLGAIAFGGAPVVLASLQAIHASGKHQKRADLFCILAGIFACLCFSIFRSRTSALYSVLFAVLPFLLRRKTRGLTVLVLPILVSISYSFVTNLRIGLRTTQFNLSEFNPLDYFMLAFSDNSEKIADMASDDLSYRYAGLTNISAMIKMQEQGLFDSHFGFRFLLETLRGFPQIFRIAIPQEWVTTTEDLVAQAFGLPRVDMIEVIYLPFLHDSHWILAIVTALFAFTLIYLLTISIIYVIQLSGRALIGAIYIYFLWMVGTGYNFSLYANFFKLILPWVGILLVIDMIMNSFTRKRTGYTPIK